MDKQGYIPIYCRITIDGIDDEISTGLKVLYADWDTENKQVLSAEPAHKAYNKKLRQMETDLERHFDLVVAQKGLATPELVFDSYRTPLNGHQQKTEKKENIEFSIQLDELIREFIKLSKQEERLDRNPVFRQRMGATLTETKEKLGERLERLTKRGEKIFDNKMWAKTLLLATDEYLLTFIQLAFGGFRSHNTLMKRSGCKKRLQEFMHVRFNKEDVVLADLEYKFITEYIKYNQLKHANQQNTLWKYAQVLQETMNRAVSLQWVNTNIFGNFECRYVEPDEKAWPTQREMARLIQYEFDAKDLSDIRDIFVFQSFAAPGYSDLHGLKSDHLVSGIDGKTWFDKRRRKTKVPETLPLLPICLEILDKFKDDPRCLRSGRLLPVPTDQHYNRALKKIARIVDIPCLNNSHQARYFFVNEVAHTSGIDPKTISKMIGQKNARSIDTSCC